MTYNSESKQNIKRSTASDIKTYLCDHPAWTVLYFKTETSQKDINKKQYNSHSRNGYVLWTAGCMCPEPSVQTWLTHSLTLKQTLQIITLSQKYFCISCDTVEYILVGKSNYGSCLESHSTFCLQAIYLKRHALIHLYFFQLWSWAA